MRCDFKRTIRGRASACLLLAMAACAAGDTLYSTSGGTSNSGGINFDGYVGDYLGSSSISGEGLGGNSENVPFSIQLALPDDPFYNITAAPLNFAGTGTATDGPGYSESSGPEGSYVTGTYFYSCGFLETCEGYDYSSQYSSASFDLAASAAVVLTQISSTNTTWTGSMSSGTVDLLTLGFGPDLSSGGTLTMSGYLDLAADFSGIGYGGFNSYNDASGYYYASGAESASLEMDGTTPEPSTVFLIGASLVGLGALRRKNFTTLSKKGEIR